MYQIHLHLCKFQTCHLGIVESCTCYLGIAILGIIIVLLISIPLGILAAIRKNTWLHHVIQIFSVFTVCVPAFWLGLGLLILFGIVLHSMKTIIGGAVGIWIWVPALSIALGYTGQYIGLLRDNMIDVLEKPYIKAAKVRESTHFALLCSMLSKMLLFLF